MNIINSPEIINSDGTISLPYTILSGRYTFNDAIVGFEEDIRAMTDDQILAEQTKRFNVWHEFILNPPPPSPIIPDPVEPESA